MIPLTEIALLTIAVAICILVLIVVPTLIAIKRTADSVGELSDMIRNELQPTLQELTGVLTELKVVGGSVAQHTDDVKRFMSALGETGNNLSTINRSASVITGVLGTTSAWAIGAKVAGKYLMERYLKKRGGE